MIYKRQASMAFTLMLLLSMTIDGKAQRIENMHARKIDAASYDNIKVDPLDDDSLSSTFMIWVKEGVKEHYHEKHTEVVYVLEGAGRMKLNDHWQTVQAGDYIFIPKGTRHAVEVSSAQAMKVISIQSPRFEGKDRVFVSPE